MTRKEIAVQILSSMVSTSGGLLAIGQSAVEAGIDPFVYAVRSALRFTDALLVELGPEQSPVKDVPNFSLADVFGKPPKPKRTRKKTVSNEN